MRSLFKKEKLKGVLALFDHPEDLVKAISEVKKNQLSKIEAFTPYPVHEVIEALKIKRSWIPWATFLMGLTGLGLGFLLQVWTMAYNWPLNVGGKPMISWPAFIPVTFEAMVLIGGVSTVLILVFGYIIPNFLKPILDPRLTENYFGLFVDESDSSFNPSTLNQIFKDCDAKEIKNVG